VIRIKNLNVFLFNFKLKSIDLSIEAGEFFVLLGPTGAGKTLILESIMGLIPPSSGCIWVNGKDLTALPPETRNIGIVYQDHALFPHLSVLQNITYGVRYIPPDRQITAGELEALIKRLSLGQLINRSVVNLSGGEKQRVALARALAVKPAVLLLDEPLSSLDPNFREEIRHLLKQLHQETGITVLMVTHNFVDAHFFAKRVAVINNGAIEQIGTLAEVFNRPRTPFVANFVGMQNVFPASFGNAEARVEDLCIRLMAGVSPGMQYIAIRPEHIRIHGSGDQPPQETPNQFRGTIATILNKGFQCNVTLSSGSVQFESLMTAGDILSRNLKEGDRVTFSFDSARVHTL
jgi:molybdate/tungstate transport system ATP-binding protein